MIRGLFRIKKDKIRLLAELFIFKLILDFMYIYFINAEFSYNNFILDFNIEKYIISLIWFIIICYVLPEDMERPSSVILLLHYLIMVLPIFTVYVFKNESTTYFNMVCICFFLECILMRYLPTKPIKRLKEAKYIFYILIVIITVFVYFSMLEANGIPSLKALNLLQVYEVREDVKYPFLMNYLVNWQSKVINPLMIAVSYKKKDKKTLLVFIALQLLIYLITAHKTYLFIPVAIILVMFIYDKFNNKKIVHIITAAASFGCVVAYLVYKLEITTVIASYFIRRLMFVPAQIKFYYYDFISKNEFLYFSEGSLGKLLGTKYPYDTNFVNLISNVYFNNDSASNSGYLGSGYANLGFSGMLIYTVIIALILALIDSIGKNLGNSLVVGIILFLMLSLNDSDLLTTLLTGGLLFMVLLLYLYASFNSKEDVDIYKNEEHE